MNLDPRTVVILTILSTSLMGISLFVVARGYLSQMRGVTRWAYGTLLQSSGWCMLALIGVAPAYIAEIGSPLIMLGLALYYHALVAFKQSGSSVKWVYATVVLNVILIYLFLLVYPDMSARIVVASATGAILMFASALLLLADGWRQLSFSHRITGLLFALCSVVLTVRAIYYLVWNTAPDQSAFEQNLVQDIAFLTFFLAGVVSSFTFILMCNDRYNEQSKQRAEELAQKNTELEQANQAKGQFLATMSHEIRTPLNGVMGFLNQLEKTSLNELQRDYLLTINHSARILMGVINDVLDYSKIEAGKLALEKIETDLRIFLDDLVAMYSASANEKALDLVCIVDRRLNCYVMIDTLRMTQILSNLIGNAIKFTREGSVVVEARKVGESANAVHVQFLVTDTGIGISQQDMSRLFQPFTQADVSTTRKYGGTGLGLIIAKRLVDLMDGQLEISSEVGKGTCFTINLELQKSSVPGVEYCEAFASNIVKPALIVSIEAETAKSIVESLSFLGVACRIVSGGLATIELLGQDATSASAFSLIIYDQTDDGLYPEEFSSLAVTEHVAGLPKLILLCRQEQCRQIGDLKNIGFDLCLSKPVRMMDLYKCLGEMHTDGTRVHSSTIRRVVENQVNNRMLYGMRVLVVDDNAVNRKLVQILVGQLGGEFDIAENGLHAVEACRNSEYDLVLMDVNMPEMDGIQAAQIIRQEKLQPEKTLLVALTANALPGDRERFINSGMNDYLSKPVNVPALANLLRRWGLDMSALAGQGTEKQPDNPHAVPILDPELGISQSLDDEHTWNTVLGMVLDELGEYADIFSTLTILDKEQLAFHAHKLAGSSSYCGTPALYQVAKDLEHVCMRGLDKDILTSLENIKKIIETMISLDRIGKLRGSRAVVY